MHMCNCPDSDTLEQLRRQMQAWREHLAILHLDDRQRFVQWLSEVLSKQELGLIIDSEVDRRSLWRVYLREHYGP